MTARRALTPAARGVSLAVLAALRAGRVDLADQADGSTLATSTAPDGTELLRATLHMPVRGVDTRTPTLPNVSMAPQPAEVPPAPVATPAGEERAAEAPAPQPTTVRCWITAAQWDEAHKRDAENEQWLLEPVAGTVLDWENVGVWARVQMSTGPVLDELRKVCTRVGVTLHESDTMPPPPPRPEPVRVNGLGPGDLIEMDGAKACVGGVDHEGFAWCEVNGDGFLTGPVERALWSEVEHVEGNLWRARPVETETPSQKAKREKAAKKIAKPKAPKAPVAAEPPQGDDAPEVRLWIREAEWDSLDENTRTEFEELIGGSGVDWQGREGFVTALVPADEILTALRGMASAVGITLHEGDELPAAKAPKAKPARNVPVPEADALAIYGEVSFVGQEVDGGPWELAAHGQSMPSRDETWATCRASYVRVREYTRGKRCSRDSRDRGAK